MIGCGRLALRRVTAGMLAALSLASLSGQAAEISCTVYSAHVWRGQVRNRNPVLRAALSVAPHPALLLEGNTFFDVTGRDPTTKALVSRVELSALYLAPPIGPLQAGLGLIERRYPGTTPQVSGNGAPPFDRERATEGILALNLRSFLAPYVDSYLDLRNADRLYTTLGLGHLWFLAPDLPTMEIAASLAFANAAYNQAHYAVDHAALHDGALSLLLRKDVDRTTSSIILEMTYSRILDQRLRTTLEVPDRFYGGFGLEVRF